MAYSGSYKPKNPHKYRGDLSKIQYRSNWEKFYMQRLDTDPRYVSWSSEEVVIPYFSTADDKKRRYFMDFWCKTKDGQEFIIEVKPYKETQPPKPPAQLTASAQRRFRNEIYTYQVNTDKWIAAKAFAAKNGLKFRILTENGLRKMGYSC